MKTQRQGVCNCIWWQAMQNHIEKLGNFEDAEKNLNIVEWLNLIEPKMHDANKKNHSSMKMA